MIKKFSKSKVGQSIIAVLIAFVIKTLSNTIRWKTFDHKYKLEALNEPGPIIVVFWHLPCCHRHGLCLRARRPQVWCLCYDCCPHPARRQNTFFGVCARAYLA